MNELKHLLIVLHCTLPCDAIDASCAQTEHYDQHDCHVRRDHGQANSHHFSVRLDDRALVQACTAVLGVQQPDALAWWRHQVFKVTVAADQFLVANVVTFAVVSR